MPGTLGSVPNTELTKYGGTCQIPNIQEVETKGPEFQRHPWLHGVLGASLGFMKPFLKGKRNNYHYWALPVSSPVTLISTDLNIESKHLKCSWVCTGSGECVCFNDQNTMRLG